MTTKNFLSPADDLSFRVQYNQVRWAVQALRQARGAFGVGGWCAARGHTGLVKTLDAFPFFVVARSAAVGSMSCI